MFRKLKLLNPYLRKAKFFLVRSVFEENIEIAQDKSVWATLPHNEKKFNHAFSVSKSFFSRKRLDVITLLIQYKLYSNSDCRKCISVFRCESDIRISWICKDESTGKAKHRRNTLDGS